MTIKGCCAYQAATIETLLSRHHIQSAERTGDGWLTDGKKATSGIASALSKIADRYGYNLHRTGRREFLGTDHICWARGDK